RGVVEVHDDVRSPGASLEGALDQFGTRLRQNLDGDVVGDRIVFDDLADEIEVGLARGREPDLDLLVPHANQQIEHAALAGGAHRVDERLIAVAQVDGAPSGRSVDDLVGPGAVGQRDRLDLLGE